MVDRSELDPDGIARREFTTAFRGFDQVEVRAFLSSTAMQLRQVLDRQAELSRRLDEAEQRAAQADTVDEHRLTELLGEETARIFEAAREAAAEIRAKAEAKTAQLVRDAQDDANRMTSEATELLRLRTSEADTAAATIRADAEAARDKMLADARVEVDAMRVQAGSDAERIRGEAQAVLDQAVLDAEAAVESALREGREMVAEAQVVRERILKDLARRRRAGKAQLEQLRAARERLLEAYAVVRRTVDEATTELAVAVPEAKLAADAAGRRVDLDDDDLTVEAIEAELDAGRVAGVPLLDTGEVPVVRADAPPPLPSPPAAPSVPVRDRAPDPAGADPGDDDLGDGDRGDELQVVPTHEDEAHDGEAHDGDPGDGEVEVEDALAETAEADDPVGGPATGGAVVGEEALTDREGPAVGEPAAEFVLSDAAPRSSDADDGPVGGVADLFARLRSEVPEQAPDEAEGEDDDEDEADPGEVGPDSPAPAPGEVVEGGAVEGQDGAVEDGGEGDDADEDDADEDDVDETVLERRDRHLADLELDLGRVLKRRLADDENAKLDLIRRRAAKGGTAEVLPPIEEHRVAFVEAVSDALVLAAAAGTEMVGELLHPDDPPPEVVEVEVDLDDIAVDLVDSLLVPIRDRVSELVEGSEGDDALDGVRACYRRGKGTVAELASQFVHTAFNRGAFDAVPDGTLVRWVVDPGAGPCPDGEDDALEGPIAKGTPFPTGHLHPPAHPGCRCLLVPGVL